MMDQAAVDRSSGGLPWRSHAPPAAHSTQGAPIMVLSLDCMPVFTPTILKASEIPVFQCTANLMDELRDKHITKAEAISLYDQMCAVRALEEMIYQLRSGAYAPLAGKYEYQGPTHLSIGQEAASVGACSVLKWDD